MWLIQKKIIIFDLCQSAPPRRQHGENPNITADKENWSNQCVDIVFSILWSQCLQQWMKYTYKQIMTS